MEEETHFLSSLEGYRWQDEDPESILASSLADFDGVDYSQVFPTESSWESMDSSASEIFEPDPLALSSLTPLPDLHTPPDQWQDIYTPFTEFTTPNSSNMTWTPSSGGAVPGFSSSSISSEFPPLSPEQPNPAWALPSPFGGLHHLVLFDQTIQQTDPVRYDSVISPNIMTNAPGLPPEADTLTSTPPQQRRRSGPPAREWRQKERPTKCPVCNKGFPYKSDMDRHILTNHAEQALEFGVSTIRPTCLVCGKTFARKDHKVRHDQRLHNAPKTNRRSRRKG